jgi:hypothetical protein
MKSHLAVAVLGLLLLSLLRFLLGGILLLLLGLLRRSLNRLVRALPVSGRLFVGPPILIELAVNNQLRGRICRVRDSGYWDVCFFGWVVVVVVVASLR